MIDRTWGPLARSHHERGSWTARIGGRTFSGDWKITSVDRSFNPKAHQATQETWVHYVGGSTGDYCAVSLENPGTMYCRPACKECASSQAPTSIVANVQRVEVFAKKELQLYALIHRVPLATQLGVSLQFPSFVEFSFQLPYRIETKGSRVHWSTPSSGGYDRQLVGYEVEIEIGPRATDIVVKGARETERVAERCTYPAHAATSCMPIPPICEVR